MGTPKLSNYFGVSGLTYQLNIDRCSTGCSAGNKRKRREVTRDEIEHDESTTKIILTGGPLVIKEKTRNRNRQVPYWNTFLSFLNRQIIDKLSFQTWYSVSGGETYKMLVEYVA